MGSFLIHCSLFIVITVFSATISQKKTENKSNLNVSIGASDLQQIHKQCLFVVLAKISFKELNYTENGNSLSESVSPVVLVHFQDFGNAQTYRELTHHVMNTMRYYTQQCTILIHDMKSYLEVYPKTSHEVIVTFLADCCHPARNGEKVLLPLSEPAIVYLMFPNKSTNNSSLKLVETFVRLLFHSYTYTTEFFAIINNIPFSVCFSCDKIMQRVTLSLNSQSKISILEQRSNTIQQFNGLFVLAPHLMVFNKKFPHCLHRIRDIMKRKNNGVTAFDCAFLTVEQILNISFVKNTPPMDSKPTAKILDVDISSRLSTLDHLNYRFKYKQIPASIYEIYCLTSERYYLQIFVHKNTTSSTKTVLQFTRRYATQIIWIPLATCVVVSLLQGIRPAETSGENGRYFCRFCITLYYSMYSFVRPSFMWISKTSAKFNCQTLMLCNWWICCSLYFCFTSGLFIFYKMNTLDMISPSSIEELLSKEEFKAIPIVSTSYVMHVMSHDVSFLVGRIVQERLAGNPEAVSTKLNETYHQLLTRILIPKKLSTYFSCEDYFHTLSSGIPAEYFNYEGIKSKNTMFVEKAVANQPFAFIDTMNTLKRFQEFSMIENLYEQTLSSSTDLEPYGFIIYSQKSFVSKSIHEVLGWIDNSGVFRKWERELHYFQQLDGKYATSKILKYQEVNRISIPRVRNKSKYKNGGRGSYFG